MYLLSDLERASARGDAEAEVLVGATAVTLAEVDGDGVDTGAEGLTLTGHGTEGEGGVVGSSGLTGELELVATEGLTVTRRRLNSGENVEDTNGLGELVLHSDLEGSADLARGRKDRDRLDGTGSRADRGADIELHADPERVGVSILDKSLELLNTLNGAEGVTGKCEVLVGQSLAELSAGANDTNLLDDAEKLLESLANEVHATLTLILAGVNINREGLSLSKGQESEDEEGNDRRLHRN